MGKKDTAAIEPVAEGEETTVSEPNTSAENTAAPEAKTEAKAAPVAEKHVRVMFNYSFEQGVAEFIKSTARSRDLARFCAETALRHFVDHGDTSKLKQLHDAMLQVGKNYVRVNAYKAWIQAHAPLRIENGAWLKDKTKEFDKELIQQAMDTPFWDFLPEPEVKRFDFTDVLVKLKKDMTAYRNSDKYVAIDPAVFEKMAKVEGFLATM